MLRVDVIEGKKKKSIVQVFLWNGKEKDYDKE